ncbi:hypothetical protein SAMN04488103_1124 [Gemmobacter aquatilis]|uniref:Uncharacterized protein n=1 Tax=Gemmobacter aquatilis TaxID=933059 RepID=A0A1H8LXL4_9RHOB|nr:hypothetical protein [Gemmobacter aquatilis]SEO09831.1 hypothetical protein SAMN04488103_1124 [Gemmobacter aquatilis]
MISKIQDASPTDLIEFGFHRAYEAKRSYHAKWRAVQKRLEEIRGNGTPHDAGDNDVYFDLLLRQMEDEHAQYIANTGEPCHPYSRTRIQIQLTRYWVVSVGEMLRATRNGTEEGSAICKRLNELVDRFGAIRMMVAKQDVQTHGAPAPETILSAILIDGPSGENSISCERIATPKAYQVRPIIKRETGSIVFPVYDAYGNVLWDDDRQGLSDLLLKEFS